MGAVGEHIHIQHIEIRYQSVVWQEGILDGEIIKKLGTDD